MTIEELYAQIGGNYEDAFARLRSDALITRILAKFLDDTTCPDVIAAWGRDDETGTFEAAHAAKGVCMNLGFAKLGVVTSEITEALRPGNEGTRASTDVDALVEELKSEYGTVRLAVEDFLTAQ